MFKWLFRKENKKKPPVVERRGAERHPIGIKVADELTVSVGLSSWPAVVCDISTTGIGLIMGMRPSQASAFPIKLRCNKRGVSYTLEAYVVRAILLPDGNWFCGCVFQQPLQEADLQVIL